MYLKKEYRFYQFGESAYKKAYKLYQLAYFFWKGRKDRKKIKLLREYIKPGMTIVDIGANIGFYTTIFLKLVGEKGKVYAFEPDELNFQHLLANTATHKNAINNKTAVSDKSGKIRFYPCDINVDHQTYDNGEGRPFTEIDCVSMDDFFNNGQPVDLLKTDTQGFDYFVISGMKELVKKSKHFILITEFWPFGLNKAGTDPGEFIAQLKEMGFVLTFMDTRGEHEYRQLIDDWSYYTDIIAIKKSV